MVGDILRKRREETGQDLREISKTLKIRYDYLNAIEEEAFEKLPEEVYVKGYIREYAEILKIDPEIAVKAYIQQTSPPQVEKTEVPEKEILQREKIKIRYFLILLLSALLVTTAFILFRSSQGKKELSPAPAEMREEIPQPYVETKKEIPQYPDEAKKDISTPPIEPEKENILKAEITPHVLEVFATDTTWLFVNIDNTNAKEMLLKPGESVKFEAKNSFSLKIGNAGGAKLIFDGKEIDKLGEKGQVVKVKLPYAKM